MIETREDFLSLPQETKDTFYIGVTLCLQDGLSPKEMTIEEVIEYATSRQTKSNSEK